MITIKSGTAQEYLEGPALLWRTGCFPIFQQPFLRLFGGEALLFQQFCGILTLPLSKTLF